MKRNSKKIWFITPGDGIFGKQLAAAASRRTKLIRTSSGLIVLLLFGFILLSGAVPGNIGFAAGATTGEISKLDPWFRALSTTAPGKRIADGIDSRFYSPFLHADSALLTNDRVRVQIETGPTGIDVIEIADQCQQSAPSLLWEGFAGQFGQATVAIDELNDLSAISTIRAICRPPVGVPQVTSAGLAEIGAEAFHEAGICGEGIKIGVLDVSFGGASELIGGELPSDTKIRSFWHLSGGGVDITGGQDRGHGTACAEIIADIAPCAQLFLCNAGTLVEMESAIRWLREEGVHVINYSVGWFWGPGDGTGTIANIVRQATDSGIIWVNAAGNYASHYWQDTWNDENDNEFHEFSEDDESITYYNLTPGTEMRWILAWDRWPYSAGLTFDLELYQGGLKVGTSEHHDSFAWAYRDLSFDTRNTSQPLELRIKRTTGEDGARLRIFQIDPAALPLPEHGDAEGSLVIPADCPDVISVGAYGMQGNQPLLEVFSSRGPTMSGLVKPEICALDNVATSRWNPFTGTSAAAPLAAGAIGVLLDSAPAGGFFDFAWTREDIFNLLAAYAFDNDLGDPNSSRWGLLRLPDSQQTTYNKSAPRLLSSSPTDAPVKAKLVNIGSGDFCFRVLDVNGRLVCEQNFQNNKASSAPVQWDGFDFEGRRLPSGIYWISAEGASWKTSRSIVLIR